MSDPARNGCDFAYPPSNITIEEFYRLLYALGVRVVQRYLWRGGKGLTAPELAAAKNAGPNGGIIVAIGFERYANSWRRGAPGGVADAAEAASIAASLGIPHGTPIIYAVDEDAEGLGMLDVGVAYVHGANRPDYPSWGYGQFALAEALKKPTFQTYAWPPHNPDGSLRFGAVSKYAALYQWKNNQTLAGGTVDFCEIRDAAALGYHPNPGIDLLEWIMSLAGAPAGLTYQQLLHDIAEAVWNDDTIPNPSADPAVVRANPSWTPTSYLEQFYKREAQDIALDVHDVALDSKP